MNFTAYGQCRNSAEGCCSERTEASEPPLAIGMVSAALHPQLMHGSLQGSCHFSTFSLSPSLSRAVFPRTRSKDCAHYTKLPFPVHIRILGFSDMSKMRPIKHPRMFYHSDPAILHTA